MRLTALALSVALLGGVSMMVGCDREVSSQEKTKVSSDGTVTREQKTVTEKSDGTTVTEEKKDVQKP